MDAASMTSSSTCSSETTASATHTPDEHESSNGSYTRKRASTCDTPPVHYSDTSSYYQYYYGSRAVIYTSASVSSPTHHHDTPVAWSRNPMPTLAPAITTTTLAVPPFQPIQAVRQFQNLLYQTVIRHFLPANYPTSVDSGYGHFAAYSMVAAVAGSASMVLSTQTLLVAVVAGSGATLAMTSTTSTTAATAAVSAGALNWIFKDGVGQLGGILLASRLGHTRALDANPKYWRMVAAIVLDGAALLELVTPLVVVFVVGIVSTGSAPLEWCSISLPMSSSSLLPWTMSTLDSSVVLTLACTATVLKNIGFLCAGASRAALHQSLATSGNLADVTGKSASQSMAAGLMGTGLGLAVSQWCGGAAVDAALVTTTTTVGANTSHYYFLAAFVGLAAVHQVGNYMALIAVALRHLNRQRLCLVLQHYMASPMVAHNSEGEHNVLTPAQVAQLERFVPWWVPPWRDNDLHYLEDDSTWLCIGSTLPTMCPDGSSHLSRLMQACPGEQYIINVVDVNDHCWKIHLVFLESATGIDVIRGMLHAYTLRHDWSVSMTTTANDTTKRPSRFSSYRDDDDDGQKYDENMPRIGRIAATHGVVQSIFPYVLAQLHAAGWQTGTDVTSVEDQYAVRFAINPIHRP